MRKSYLIRKKTNNISIGFVIGTPRSGTTILMEILDAHPYVAVCYENRDPIRERFFHIRQNDLLLASDIDSIDLRYFYDFIQQGLIDKRAKILIDKDTRNILRLSFLANILPHAKFIHIIRDGRDVSRSISIITNLKPLSSIGLWWGTRIPGFMELINYVPNTSILGALQWYYCVKKAIECLEEHDITRYLEINYEEFVEKTNLVGQKILNFLALPSNSEFFRKCKEVSNKVYFGDGQITSAKSLTTSKDFRIGAFKKDLTDDELKVIEWLIGNLLKKLGYKLVYQNLLNHEINLALRSLNIDIPGFLDWMHCYFSNI